MGKPTLVHCLGRGRGEAVWSQVWWVCVEQMEGVTAGGEDVCTALVHICGMRVCV